MCARGGAVCVGPPGIGVGRDPPAREAQPLAATDAPVGAPCVQDHGRERTPVRPHFYSTPSAASGTPSGEPPGKTTVQDTLREYFYNASPHHGGHSHLGPRSFKKALHRPPP